MQNFVLKTLSNVPALKPEAIAKSAKISVPDFADKTDLTNYSKAVTTYGKALLLPEISQHSSTAILENVNELFEIYSSKINSLGQEFSEKFKGIGQFSYRAKGASSIKEKLVSKYKKGEFASGFAKENVAAKIGDGYGLRITLESLKEDKIVEILNKHGTNKVEFSELISKDFNSFDEKTKEKVNAILNDFKEAQCQPFVDRLLQLINDDKVQLACDEFNNYGSEITSYLTKKQLAQIALMHEKKTGEPLAIVTKNPLTFEDTKNIKSVDGLDLTKFYGDFSKEAVEKRAKKAVKDSGYSGTQMNLVTTATTGKPLADTELQVRGEFVHKFAEVEHIPYDIKKGKIKPGHKDFEKCKDIYKIIKCMDEKSYESYQEYLAQTYKYLRLKEFGIEIPEPKLPTDLRYAEYKDLPFEFRGFVNPQGLIENSELLSKAGLEKIHG